MNGDSSGEARTTLALGPVFGLAAGVANGLTLAW
jgi:hypothetical protein